MRKLDWVILSLSLYASCAVPVSAQPSPVGNWLMYFGNQPIHQDWTLWNELQIRQHNIAGDFHQVIARAGIGYNLTPDNNNLLMGYGFFYSQNYVGDTEEKISTIEHRIFQQFIHRQSLNRVAIQHRLRTEERFLPGSFQFRFRYLLGLNIPINKDRMGEGAVYASIFNELFLIPDTQTFDRNRIYAALGYVFHPGMRAEFGIMRQTTLAIPRDQIQVAVFNNIALY